MSGFGPDALLPTNVEDVDIEKRPVSGQSLSGSTEKAPNPVGKELNRTPTNSSQIQHSNARLIALVVTLTGAAFLNTLSVQACVIVLPTIGRHLHIPSARQQWIVSAYSLTFGCFLLLWGRLADVYGKRLIFVWGSLWVTIMCIAIPFCPTEISFDVLRGLQGFGAAANVPTAIGILGVTFPPGKAKNYAFSFYSAGAPMGSVFGNLLGGIVAQYASWQWIFWILAILAGIVTLAGYFVIPLPAKSASPRDLAGAVDWIGGVLITVSLIALMFAMTQGNVVGWSTPYIPVLIVVAILLLAVFVVWQLYLEKRTTRPPLMKVTIFCDARVSAAMVTMALFFTTFNNYLVFATYFYQEYLALDAIDTTIRFIPTGVVGCLTIFATSQLLARVKVNHILLFSITCVSISVLLFAVPISPSTTYWAYGFPAMCLSVFGADTLYPSLMLFTSHSLPRENQALGGALINAVAQIARAIGLAIGTAIQVAVQAKREHLLVTQAQTTKTEGNKAYLEGLRAAEWFSFGMGVAGFFVISVFLRGTGIIGLKK